MSSKTLVLTNQAPYLSIRIRVYISYETILKIPPRKSSDPTTTATLNQALKDLTEKATTEQQLPQNHITKS
jgi:hypothetical protein